MNGYITTSRHNSLLDAPILLPQTELRRGRYIIAGQIKLTLGQVLRIRCFTLHFVNILTPTVTPSIFNTAMGLVSASVTTTPMVCSSPLRVSATAPSVVAHNSFSYVDFATPATYYFLVSNNTSNVDISVSLTGVAKILNYG